MNNDLINNRLNRFELVKIQKLELKRLNPDMRESESGQRAPQIELGVTPFVDSRAAACTPSADEKSF